MVNVIKEKLVKQYVIGFSEEELRSIVKVLGKVDTDFEKKAGVSDTYPLYSQLCDILAGDR